MSNKTSAELREEITALLNQYDQTTRREKHDETMKDAACALGSMRQALIENGFGEQDAVRIIIAAIGAWGGAN